MILDSLIRKVIREEFNRERTLYAFDLDDTLITTKSLVLVHTPKGIKKLTPAQFALYSSAPDERLDFSEFKYIKDPELIRSNVRLFLDALSKSSHLSKTIILTARTPDVVDDIQALLNSKNLPEVEIYAVGSSDPNEKAKVIQNFINEGFTQIRFYDDSPYNVAAVNKLKTVNPDVDIKAKLVVNALHEESKGLWHNIRAKRARGEKPSHPNSKAFKSAVKAGKEILKKQSNEITKFDVYSVDQYADTKFNPTDIVLTSNHFFDRVKDTRNEKPISTAELIGFFKRLSKNRRKFIDFLNTYKEIVAHDNRTDLNIPFIKQANQVIAKTIMRKPDFKSSNPVLTFEDESKPGEALPEKDADPKELAIGIEAEMKEHDKTKEEAKLIALQHLKEDEKYYSKLKKIGL